MIVNLNDKELNKKVDDLKKELFDNKIKKSFKKLKNFNVIKKNKKNIANLLTLINFIDKNKI